MPTVQCATGALDCIRWPLINLAGVDCPQSICTTQDIAICYGNVDGPGYAPERIAVCKETLARIDPSWGCHTCISLELADALIDAGRPHDALALLERGTGDSRKEHSTRARALYAAGALQDVLPVLDTIKKTRFDDETAADRYASKCLRFQTLAKMREAKRAWKALPPEAEGIEHGENIELVIGLTELFRISPEHNTHVTGRRVEAALRRYDRVGAHRLAVEVAVHCVTMAVARGARRSALRALAMGRPHLAKLRVPLGAPEQFAELDALVAAMPQAPLLPVPPSALAAHVRDSESDNSEQELEWLLAAAVQLPDDPELALSAAAAMRACGAKREACDYLWQFLRAHPGESDVGAALLVALLDLQDYAGAMEMAQFLRALNPALSHWCLARLAFEQEQWTEVGEHVTRLLEVKPDAQQSKGMWADAAMEAGQFDTALRLREDLAGHEDEVGSIH